MKIVVLPNGSESPLENHSNAMEFAVCEESRTFYVFELFAAVYGMNAIESACNRYASAKGWK